MVSVIFTVAFAVFCIYLYRLFSKNEKNGKMPPGPWAVPFFGNLFQLGMRPHLVITEWAKKYGDIFTVRFGLDTAVIVDDPKIIREMFNEAAFSGRPENEIFLLQSEGKNGIISSDGEPWEEQRRFTLRHLRDFGFGKNYMEELIIEEVKDVIDWFKREEGIAVSVNRKFSLAVLNGLWSIISGQRYSQEDPKLTNLLDQTQETFNEIQQKGLLIFTPWMRHIIPEYSGWNQLLRQDAHLKKFFKDTIVEHKKSFQPDSNPRDYIDSFLLKMHETTDQNSSFYKYNGDKHLQSTLLDLFQAGSETTSTTLSWIVLYLTANQQVQLKMQKEIDAVVGKTRLPSLTDRPNMPYTEAVLLEVLRMSSLVPLGVFHRTLFDKEFHGYMIPKGTWIMPNIYSIHYNPKYWGDPQNFRPERFLSEDGKSVIKNEALIPFVVGKRACLGEPLARDSLFLFTSSIFQRFHMRPDPANPKLEFESIISFIQAPKKFTVVMKDRME